MSSKLSYFLQFVSVRIVAVAGFLALIKFTPEQWLFYVLWTLFALVAVFMVNFWYGKKLKAPLPERILASIFSGFGFLYLMGYDINLIPSAAIIGKSYDLYRHNFGLMIKYSLINLIPGVLVILLIAAILPLLMILGNNWLTAVLATLLLIAAMVGAIALSLLTGFMFIMVINNLIQGLTNPGMRQLAKQTLPRVWPGFLTSLLVSITAFWPMLVGMLGFSVLAYVSMLSPFTATLTLVKIGQVIFGLLTILGLGWGFYQAVRLSFSVYNCVLGGTSSRASLAESRQLTKNRWWALVWRVMISCGVFWLVLMGADLVVSLLSHLLGNAGPYASAILSYAFSLLVSPLIITNVIILYRASQKQSAINL